MPMQGKARYRLRTLSGRRSRPLSLPPGTCGKESAKRYAMAIEPSVAFQRHQRVPGGPTAEISIAGAVLAVLLQLGRVNAPKPDRHASQPQRVTVTDALEKPVGSAASGAVARLRATSKGAQARSMYLGRGNR